MRAKRAGYFFKLNCCERSEWTSFGKFGTFPPNSSKLRSDYLFSFQKRTNYFFQHFQRQNIYFQKVPAPPPPPSESNGRPLSYPQPEYSIQSFSQFGIIFQFRIISIEEYLILLNDSAGEFNLLFSVRESTFILVIVPYKIYCIVFGW